MCVYLPIVRFWAKRSYHRMKSTVLMAAGLAALALEGSNQPGIGISRASQGYTEPVEIDHTTSSAGLMIAEGGTSTTIEKNGGGDAWNTNAVSAQTLELRNFPQVSSVSTRPHRTTPYCRCAALSPTKPIALNCVCTPSCCRG
jgi:hypothetical protein